MLIRTRAGSLRDQPRRAGAFPNLIKFSFDRVGYTNRDRFANFVPSFENLQVDVSSSFLSASRWDRDPTNTVHALHSNFAKVVTGGLG